MRVWVGAYEWRTDPGFTGWYLPVGVDHVLDLRPLAAQAQRGGAAPARALFLTSDAVTLTGATQIASDPEEALTGPRLTRLRTALGMDASDSVRIADLLFEALTYGGDDAGVRLCPNLMPGRGGRMDLRTGSIQRSAPLDFGSPTWPVVQQRYYRAYRQLFDDVQAGICPPGHHRRVLMTWIEQFGLRDTDYQRFVPSDLPQEPPLPHNTTITESFNKADSTTLGPDLSWTEYADLSAADAWQVISNQVANTFSGGTNGNVARADSDVSSVNHTCSLSVTEVGASGFNGQIGAGCRCASSSANGYFARVLRIFDTLDVLKVVSGTASEIGSQVAITPTGLPKPITLDVNGSTLVATFNGAQTHNFSDSAISTGTRGGVWGYSQDTATTKPKGDSWQLADDAAAASGSHDLPLMGVGRGLLPLWPAWWRYQRMQDKRIRRS